MVAVQDVAVSQLHTVGQLAAKPSSRSSTILAVDGVRIHVPANLRTDRPIALLVMMHGAGGVPEHVVALAKPIAERANAIVVAPKSTGATWDVVEGGLGPDVARLDRALAAVFGAYPIDPARIAIGGFSDGASYALTLGLANGALFRTTLASSPGFESAPRRIGDPRVFISHGTQDRVLPIDRTSRRLAPRLEARGTDVEYLEFVGGHTVPPEMVAKALAWWLPNDVR